MLDDKARQALLDTLVVFLIKYYSRRTCFQSILNLTNIAEQYQTISREHSLAQSSSQSLSELFKRLKNKMLQWKKCIKPSKKLLIELILTAHPTETTRRSLIHKHIESINV